MFKLALIISAVDRVTAPLRAINERIQQATAPARQLGNSLRALANEAGLGRVTDAFKGVGQAASNVWKEVRNVGVAVLGVVASGYALIRVVTGIADAGSELRNLSVRTKIPIQTIAEFQYVAKQADITTGEWAGALDTLNKSLGQAKAGTGKLAGLLNVVNPAFLAQLKHAKGNEQALELMFQALTKLEDPNKRAALAAAAFGNEVGKKMSHLLENGTKGVEELRAEFRALAGDQTEFAERSAEFDTEWKRFTTTLEGARNAVFVQLLPAFSELLKVVQKLVLDNKDKIVAWVKSFVTNLPQHLETLTTIFKVLATVMALKVFVSVGMLIKAVVALSAALVATPLGWVILALAAIAGLVAFVASKWGEWGPTIQAAFAPAMAAIQELIDVLEPVLLPILTAIGQVVGFVLVKAFEALAAMVTTLAKGLTTVVGLFQKVGTFIGETAAKGMLAGEKVAGAVSTGASAVRDFFTGKSEASVTVDFKNLPRGARVTAAPESTADLDMSLGYAMTEAY